MKLVGRVLLYAAAAFGVLCAAGYTALFVAYYPWRGDP